ncbi:D-alanine--D-alanine ligase [bacterium SCSIO 12696]|nr:D-alanine--D-alanine ligase [bacterium SCSIO 12696]
MSTTSSTSQQSYTVPGMPQLEHSGNAVSHFEFWPTWLVYLPVIFQWLGLAIRFRSLSLPLVANPNVEMSGMVGFSKSDLMASASPDSQPYILPFITHTVGGHFDSDLATIRQQLSEQGLKLPLVGKPDLGCRGAGVCLLENEQELADYLGSYPQGSTFMLQQLASWEPEAGVFYIRHPGAPQGEIISLALKYSPYVTGDGRSTLAELMANDPRAGQLQHLYEERHQEMLDTVIPAGEPYRLVFSASHCRGAVFRDGGEYITETLRQKLDDILGGLPEFYYGRLDIKFRDTDSLTRGEDLEIVEINGASSESLHIWDSGAKLTDAWKALLFQYGSLFRIGAKNRQRGFKAPGILALWRAWKEESALVKQYPDTD